MFRVEFGDLSLGERPLTEMPTDRNAPTATINARVTLHVGGVEFPLFEKDHDMWLNRWCVAVGDLPLELVSPDGSRYRLSDPYGMVSELKYVRKGDTVTVTAPGTAKRAQCTYNEMVQGLEDFKRELKAAMRQQTSRDAVAVWWEHNFLEDYED